ncbi:MAG: hypothetical protein BJ554DRAFT_3300 [Olpidium bornovanus]|uniref:JmjC domain-containing protein n=1 Tax=Olpidium bornovanus TaxID=278681 RepID=A0A8H7ZPN9_9FUNG|nr:MAG: hypothetical protein BJ554DRAFT_3300 [Olpidium bornovanus]
MKALPYPEYTRPNCHLNLVSYLPKEFSPPDLGPKMCNAYAAQELDAAVRRGPVGTACLQLDMADAVNLMVHVGRDEDSENNDEEGDQVGAVWDIFPADKVDVVREFLRREVLPRRPPGPGASKGAPGEDAADIIHDQVLYLTDAERRLLHVKYGPGDAVYVPAGCLHQVANLRSAVKVAMDFVSPEHVGRSLDVTGEAGLAAAQEYFMGDLDELEQAVTAESGAGMNQPLPPFFPLYSSVFIYPLAIYPLA